MINNIYPMPKQAASHTPGTTAVIPQFESAALWIDDEIIWSLVIGN